MDQTGDDIAKKSLNKGGGIFLGEKNFLQKARNI